MPRSVGIVVRDRTERPLAGRCNVCYVNGFQTQPDERAFGERRPELVLRSGGRPVVGSAWGEWLLDPRTPSRRAALARVMGSWVRGCSADGYDAVEHDNLDSFTRSHLLLTAARTVAYARLLTRSAHDAGRAVRPGPDAGWRAPMALSPTADVGPHPTHDRRC